MTDKRKETRVPEPAEAEAIFRCCSTSLVFVWLSWLLLFLPYLGIYFFIPWAVFWLSLPQTNAVLFVTLAVAGLCHLSRIVCTIGLMGGHWAMLRPVRTLNLVEACMFGFVGAPVCTLTAARLSDLAGALDKAPVEEQPRQRRP